MRDPVTWWVDRSIASQRSAVDEPHLFRRVLLRVGVLFLVVLFCALIRLWWAPGSQWDVVTGAVLGALAALGALHGLSRAMAYRDGWLRGRAAMVAALGEARERGMSLDDWLAGELERDLGRFAFRRPDDGSDDE